MVEKFKTKELNLPFTRCIDHNSVYIFNLPMCEDYRLVFNLFAE